MFGTDIILGYFDKSIGVVKEFYAIGELRPKEDKSQEIYDTGITKKDGRIILEFKRKLKLSSEVSFSMPTYLNFLSLPTLHIESFNRIRIEFLWIFPNHFTWFIHIVVEQ